MPLIGKNKRRAEAQAVTGGDVTLATYAFRLGLGLPSCSGNRRALQCVSLLVRTFRRMLSSQELCRASRPCYAEDSPAPRRRHGNGDPRDPEP